MAEAVELSDLIRDCLSETRGFLRVGLDKGSKKEILKQSWSALNKWIETRLSRRLGAAMPILGSFTWEFKAEYRNVQCRPIFLVNESFSKARRIPRVKVPKESHVAPVEEVNYFNLAMKGSRTLTKDMIFGGVRTIVKKMCDYIDKGTAFELKFHFGVLRFKNKKLSFEYDYRRVAKIVSLKSTAGLLYLPKDFKTYADNSLDALKGAGSDADDSNAKKNTIDSMNVNSEVIISMQSAQSPRISSADASSSKPELSKPSELPELPDISGTQANDWERSEILQGLMNEGENIESLDILSSSSLVISGQTHSELPGSTARPRTASGVMETTVSTPRELDLQFREDREAIEKMDRCPPIMPVLPKSYIGGGSIPTRPSTTASVYTKVLNQGPVTTYQSLLGPDIAKGASASEPFLYSGRRNMNGLMKKGHPLLRTRSRIGSANDVSTSRLSHQFPNRSLEKTLAEVKDGTKELVKVYDDALRNELMISACGKPVDEIAGTSNDVKEVQVTSSSGGTSINIDHITGAVPASQQSGVLASQSASDTAGKSLDVSLDISEAEAMECTPQSPEINTENPELGTFRDIGREMIDERTSDGHVIFNIATGLPAFVLSPRRQQKNNIDVRRMTKKAQCLKVNQDEVHEQAYQRYIDDIMRKAQEKHHILEDGVENSKLSAFKDEWRKNNRKLTTMQMRDMLKSQVAARRSRLAQEEKERREFPVKFLLADMYPETPPDEKTGKKNSISSLYTGNGLREQEMTKQRLQLSAELKLQIEKNEADKLRGREERIHGELKEIDAYSKDIEREEEAKFAAFMDKRKAMLHAWKRDADLTCLKRLDKDKDPRKVSEFLESNDLNTKGSTLRELDLQSPVRVKPSKTMSGPVNYPGVWQCTGLLDKDEYRPDDPNNPTIQNLHTSHHILANDINPRDGFRRIRGLGSMGIGHDPRQIARATRRSRR